MKNKKQVNKNQLSALISDFRKSEIDDLIKFLKEEIRFWEAISTDEMYNEGSLQALSSIIVNLKRIKENI